MGRHVTIGPAVLLVPALAAGCAAPPPCRLPDGPDRVYVVEQGWHVELGLPAEELKGPLAIYRETFPGARAVMFGYGKRTFMTAAPDDIREYLLGPVPGPAVIEAVGLTVLPPAAYPGAETVALRLPPDGARALSDFIWQDLDKDRAGRPRLVGPGSFPGSLFYVARSGYSMMHTCNRWAVDALVAAGEPVAGDGVVFSGQAMARVEAALAGQCRAAPP